MPKTFVVRSGLLFMMMMSAAAGSASVSFRAAVNYPVGSNPAFAAVGDFNGDGRPDLVVVNAGDPNASDPGGISILMGNGDGTFQSAINFAAGNNPGSVAVADFDGDGKDDLAVQREGNGSNDSGDVTIFISNGDGTFTKGQVITSVLLPSAVIASDFDSDGVADLAAFQFATNSVKVLLGKGDGTFSAPNTYTIPSTVGAAKKLEGLDFNRDGKKDLAVMPFGGGGAILLGNGDGTFQAGTSLGSFGVLDTLELVGDFNHDGNIDGILTHCVIGGFPPKPSCAERAELNKGNGSFSNAPVVSALPNRTYTVSDFDGDGNLDIAGPASVFVGKGDGSFQQALTLPTNSPAFTDVGLAADLNGDKAPDLVLIDGIAGANTISVVLNSGTDFSLSAGPLTPGSIGAGQSASSALTLQLLNLFNNPVALSCSVQPAQAGAPACSVSANSVTFDSTGKASATLTVTAGALVSLARDRYRNLNAVLFPIVALVFFGVARSRRSEKKALVVFVGLIGLFSLVALPGCGGGSGSRSGQTNYVITVTGTSGQTSHSTSVNVTVN